MGGYHFVRLGESSLLEEADPSLFDSVEHVAPAGGAVPDSVAAKYARKMRNLKVRT